MCAFARLPRKTRAATHVLRLVELAHTRMQWSLIYEPKEGLIAPVTRNWYFESPSADGDENYVLFCWDGSFASLMLSLDAPELALLNLVQVGGGAVVQSPRPHRAC